MCIGNVNKPPGLLLVLSKNLEKVSVRYLSAGVSTSDQNGPRGLAYEDLQRWSEVSEKKG